MAVQWCCDSLSICVTLSSTRTPPDDDQAITNGSFFASLFTYVCAETAAAAEEGSLTIIRAEHLEMAVVTLYYFDMQIYGKCLKIKIYYTFPWLLDSGLNALGPLHSSPGMHRGRNNMIWNSSSLVCLANPFINHSKHEM